MEKTMTDAKRVTELEKRKKQLEKSTSKGYFVFLIAMLALIYIVDELTSNISSSIQPEVITDFFVMRQGIDFNIGLSNLALMSLPANIIILILPFYKALADRLGGRLFLFINTIGMGMGLLICMVAPSIYVYIVGLLVIKFFIPNDVQVMYIMECAPEQHRAKLCSMTKAIAYIGVAGIPFLRMAFMGDVVTKWRNVLIVPVILAFSVAIISFVALRETPVFLKQRIEHLENSGVASEETKKKGETGGVFHAIRFIAHHRQLRWNALAAFVFAMSIGVTGFYTSIMSTSGMNGDQINQALVAYPILNACMTFLGGFLTDRLGRKRSALTMGMVCFVMLGAFVFAASQGWNAYLVGACYGVFVGAYWSVSDLLYLVIPGESTPTNLRASVLGTLSLVLIAGGIVSTTIISICMRYVSSLALVCGVICIPLVLLCLVIVMTKLGETKGADMAKITGDEFDR